MLKCGKQLKWNVDMQDVTCQMVGNDPKHVNIVGNHAKQMNSKTTKYKTLMGTSAEVI